MPLVLDASIVLSWHFPDERNADADQVLNALRTDHALVPQHWWFEIRNVLLFGERRGRSTEAATSEFLDRLGKLRITVAPRPSDTDVFVLARAHRLTFYDAAYLELALRESMPLATLDDQLAAAAGSEGVELLVAPR